MRILKLSLEYGFGPIWRDRVHPETNKLVTLIDVVDNDEIAQKLDDEIQEMYSSYFEFNSHDEACWFNGEKEIEEAPKMLELIEKLKARLEEINDGSYVVEDYLTRPLKRMLKANGKL